MSKRSLLLMQGPRISIRPWQDQDNGAQQSWEIYSDPWSPLWNLPRCIPIGMTLLSFFSLSGTSRVWAIEDYHNRVIGRISLRDIEQWWRRARLGISLNEVYLGQGLGTEALTLFLDYYFGSFNYATLLLDVSAFNGRAIRCYERLGFVLKDYDWRQTTNTSCIQLLKDPQYHDLRDFFRQDEQGIWVQYLEMELHKRQWQERKPTKLGIPSFPSLQQ